MNKKNFKKDYLLNELDLPYNSSLVVSDKIIDTTRWSTIHELIFKDDGKFWVTGYSRGSTEIQDESPWEYDGDEIECTEVHEVEVLTKIWKAVE